MVLLRSLLVGLVAALMAAILLLLGAMAAVAVIPHPEETTLTIEPVAVAKSSPALWVLAIVVFVLGFLWDYRRTKPRLPK
jgi:FtsH-binding integral membrane protein